MTVTVQLTGSVGMVIVLVAMVIVRMRGVAVVVIMEMLCVDVVNVMMIGNVT